MTRPDVACICLDLGTHCALTVVGEHREELLELFRQEHSGPGHLPEEPPKDWHEKEAAFQRHLDRIREAMANPLLTEDAEPWRAVQDVKTAGERL
jgi:hypothetical protein